MYIIVSDVCIHSSVFYYHSLLIFVQGNTALHYAVANEKFEVVALLISVKLCNKNVVNNVSLLSFHKCT